MAEIVIEGIGELLRRISFAQAKEILRPPMNRGLANIVGYMAKYPPQPPTTYIRTGTLGRRWTMKVTESTNSLIGTVGNNTSYGPFVQSEAFQAHWMDYWQTDQDAVTEMESAIIADFERAVQGALDA